MSVIRPGNYWDSADGDDGITGDESYENLFSLLDFPMEDDLVGDWDITKSQCLGPIPANVLMEPMMNVGPPYLSSGPAVVSTGEGPELKQVSDHNQESTGSDIIQQNCNLLEIPRSCFSRTPSPISVLESSSGSCSHVTIPVRARSKRVRATVNPWLAIAPAFPTLAATSSSASKKASIPRQGRKKNVNDTVENSTTQPPQPSAAAMKKCAHCEVTKTPQWREGPTGPKTLCNACGVRYRSGRLFPEYRPAASPTFTPTLHSNSHKKVVEMRNKGKHHLFPGPGKIEDELLLSPQPEFVPMSSSYLFD